MTGLDYKLAQEVVGSLVSCKGMWLDWNGYRDSHEFVEDKDKGRIQSSYKDAYGVHSACKERDIISRANKAKRTIFSGLFRTLQSAMQSYSMHAFRYASSCCDRRDCMSESKAYACFGVLRSVILLCIL